MSKLCFEVLTQFSDRMKGDGLGVPWITYSPRTYLRAETVYERYHSEFNTLFDSAVNRIITLSPIEQFMQQSASMAHSLVLLNPGNITVGLYYRQWLIFTYSQWLIDRFLQDMKAPIQVSRPRRRIPRFKKEELPLEEAMKDLDGDGIITLCDEFLHEHGFTGKSYSDFMNSSFISKGYSD